MKFENVGVVTPSVTNMASQTTVLDTKKVDSELVSLQKYDIQETKSNIIAELANSPQVLALTDQLDMGDLNTFVKFGKEAAEGISKVSDSVLNNVELDKLNETSKLLKSLAVIMDKFDPEELSEEEKKGFLAKLLAPAKDTLEKILDKYNTMGGEIEKVYIELKKYENEIFISNDRLNQLYEANIEYFKQLTLYILAGEEGSRQIDNYRAGIEAQYLETGDNSLQLQLSNLDQGKQVLEQRIQDLRIAENVALQSLPMLKTMQFSNLNLARKINSAFIITLPIFKQALAQAVLLKRQKLQADALSALDERTNEMLLKNAKNTVEQSKLIAQLSTGSSVKMETLESTYNIIVTGIKETRQIEAEAAKKREMDKVKLEQFKQKLLSDTLLR